MISCEHNIQPITSLFTKYVYFIYSSFRVASLHDSPLTPHSAILQAFTNNSTQTTETNTWILLNVSNIIFADLNRSRINLQEISHNEENSILSSCANSQTSKSHIRDVFILERNIYYVVRHVTNLLHQWLPLIKSLSTVNEIWRYCTNIVQSSELNIGRNCK